MTHPRNVPARGDDEFLLAGERVTARQLAQARQGRAANGWLSMRRPWERLSQHEQDMAVLDAANYLHTLAVLVVGVVHIRKDSR